MKKAAFVGKCLLVLGVVLYASGSTWVSAFSESADRLALAGLWMALASAVVLASVHAFVDAKQTVVLIILTIGGLLMAAPLLWMVLSSFKPNSEILSPFPTIFPETWTVEHYKNILGYGGTPVKNYNFARYFLNSLKVAGTITLISVFANTFIGYIFCKFRFRGKKILFSMLLATMMVPFPVTMIPMFLIMGRAHLMDTHIALILPGMIGAYGVFLTRQFIKTIPDDLFAAARIDGCSEISLYWHLVIPACKAVMFALSLFTFMGAWNALVWPLILLQTQDKYTLPLALMSFGNEHETNYGLVLAAATFVIMPIIVLFLIVQKHFVEGIAMSGMKA